MRTIIITVSCILTAAIVFSCAGGGGADPKSAPARTDGPQFQHKSHIERGVECTDCHGDEKVAFKDMPSQETCMQCHADLDKDQQPVEKWAKNFFDDQGKPKWLHVTKLSSEVIYDHAKHAKSPADCKSCHAGISETDVITKGAHIDMQECMDCHRAKAPDKMECATCHSVIRADVAPDSHKLGWKKEHGKLVRLGELTPMSGECALCHKKNQCDECHRAEQPQSHNNLWRKHGHAAAASLDRDSCAACHKSDSCNECHEEARPRTHRAGWGEPFDRHCVSCHLPATGFDNQGCAVCHHGAPSHDQAPPRPATPVHAAATAATCRDCHSAPAPHPDNGDSCLACHR